MAKSLLRRFDKRASADYVMQRQSARKLWAPLGQDTLYQGMPNPAKKNLNSASAI